MIKIYKDNLNTTFGLHITSNSVCYDKPISIFNKGGNKK